MDTPKESPRGGQPPPSITYPGKRLVRAIGILLITGSCAMVVLGSTLWSDQLSGPRYALYWSWCFLLVLLTLGVALTDLVMIRRASRQSRRELFRREFTNPR